MEKENSIDESDDTLVLIHEKIESLEEVEAPPTTRHINLRQNRITKISPVPWLNPSLLSLDLYDNGISSIPPALSTSCPNLTRLDLSFNRLTHIQGIDGLVRLVELYLISNGIGKIEGLPETESLKLLELGANRIGVIEGLEGTPNIEQLFFGQNRLTSMIGLSGLKRLRVLSIQSNRITSFEGLEAIASSLQELYLSHNRLTDLSTLPPMPALRILDVCSNRLTTIPPSFASTLPALQEFWASDNLLDNLVEQLDRFDQTIAKQITTVYLGGSNPMAKHPRFVAVVRQTFPALKQIDGTILSWN